MTSPAGLRANKQAVKCDLAAQLLRRSGKLILRATGTSMVPAIWPADALVVEPATAAAVAVGDIVLFSNGCRFVAHRVVERNRGARLEQIWTRGDAVATLDAPIGPREILGKVSFIVRDGKCFAVKRNLRRSERALAALLRRSHTAARVIAGIEGLRRATDEIV